MIEGEWLESRRNGVQVLGSLRDHRKGFCFTLQDPAHTVCKTGGEAKGPDEATQPLRRVTRSPMDPQVEGRRGGGRNPAGRNQEAFVEEMAFVPSETRDE